MSTFALRIPFRLLEWLKLCVGGVFAVLITVGCATGHCPREGDRIISPVDEVDRRVWVYKYDNSKQCEPESGIKPEVMLKDFQGIKVWDTKKQNDGQARVQFCGAYTGNAYLFLIEKKDLALLKTKGYEVWDF